MPDFCAWERRMPVANCRRMSRASVPPRAGEGDQPQAGGGDSRQTPPNAENPLRHTSCGPPPPLGEDFARVFPTGTFPCWLETMTRPAITRAVIPFQQADTFPAASLHFRIAQNDASFAQADASLQQADTTPAKADTSAARVTLLRPRLTELGISLLNPVTPVTPLPARGCPCSRQTLRRGGLVQEGFGQWPMLP